MRDWLIQLRKEKNISQKNLAQKAGISQHYYCWIEKGMRGANLPAYTAKRIADALGFDWTRFYE